MRKAAKRACKLIDVCHEEAASHYNEVNGYTPLRANASPLLYEEAVRKIVGNNRFKGRLKAAIKDFEKYFVTCVDAFYGVDDDDAVATNDPKSAAYNRMQAALTVYKEKGITPSQVEEFRRNYAGWKKRKIFESRAAAGAKGGIEKANKQRAKDAKTGKFKKKGDFFLTPDEQAALDAKVTKLAGKKAKKLPS